MICPKCGRPVDANAVICPGCDFILDTDFLGDEILDEEKALRPGQGGVDPAVFNLADAVILGDIDEVAQSFETSDSGFHVRESTGARLYVSGRSHVVMAPDAVPAVVEEKAKGVRLTPFERHVLGFIDGRRPVEAIRLQAGLDEAEVKTALATLADKGVVQVVGRALVDVDPFLDTSPRRQRERRRVRGPMAGVVGMLGDEADRAIEEAFRTQTGIRPIDLESVEVSQASEPGAANEESKEGAAPEGTEVFALRSDADGPSEEPDDASAPSAEAVDDGFWDAGAVTRTTPPLKMDTSGIDLSGFSEASLVKSASEDDDLPSDADSFSVLPHTGEISRLMRGTASKALRPAAEPQATNARRALSDSDLRALRSAQALSERAHGTRAEEVADVFSGLSDGFDDFGEASELATALVAGPGEESESSDVSAPDLGDDSDVFRDFDGSDPAAIAQLAQSGGSASSPEVPRAAPSPATRRFDASVSASLSQLLEGSEPSGEAHPPAEVHLSAEAPPAPEPARTSAVEALELDDESMADDDAPPASREGADARLEEDEASVIPSDAPTGPVPGFSIDSEAPTLSPPSASASKEHAPPHAAISGGLSDSSEAETFSDRPGTRRIAEPTPAAVDPQHRPPDPALAAKLADPDEEEEDDAGEYQETLVREPTASTVIGVASLERGLPSKAQAAPALSLDSVPAGQTASVKAPPPAPSGEASMIFGPSEAEVSNLDDSRFVESAPSASEEEGVVASSEEETVILDPPPATDPRAEEERSAEAPSIEDSMSENSSVELISEAMIIRPAARSMPLRKAAQIARDRSGPAAKARGEDKSRPRPAAPPPKYQPPVDENHQREEESALKSTPAESEEGSPWALNAPSRPEASLVSEEPEEAFSDATEVLDGPRAVAEKSDEGSVQAGAVVAAGAVSPLGESIEMSEPLRPAAGRNLNERRRKAERLFQEALKDHREGRIGAARMNAKLATIYDPHNEEYRAALEQWSQGPAAARPASQAGYVALYQKAQEREQQGDVDGAILLLERGAREYPDIAAIHNRLGVLLALHRRNYEAAAKAIQKAIELDPQNLHYKSNYGKIVARQNQHARRVNA